MLKSAVEAAEPSIFVRLADYLDPAALELDWQHGPSFDVLWLNYHAARHSRWHVSHIQEWQRRGVKVVVTWHDTGVPNSDHCQAICAAADAFVVHEPYDDLEGNGRYWRMGVPDFPQVGPRGIPGAFLRPYLGTVGHDFGWKHFDQLAEITGDVGWGLLICTPEMTATREAQLLEKNPWTVVRTALPTCDVVASLRGCDATAFLYGGANTGQSGAVCLGIAARKRLYAFRHNRQFRALLQDDVGARAITWLDSFVGLKLDLLVAPIERIAPRMVQLAEQDSWSALGKKYAGLYREVLE